MNNVILVLIMQWSLLMGFLIPPDSDMRQIEGIDALTGKFIAITLKNGKIEAIDPKESAPTGTTRQYISPGLIDVQINGYASVSFNERDLTVEKIERATAALWKEGTTTYLPTLITNDPEIIIQNLEMLEKARELPEVNASVPGYFLEGPYISPDDGFRGAHSRDWVRQPDWEEFSRFVEVANHNILQMGLSPEFPGSMSFIEKCIAEGIMVSLAHHNGNAQQIEQAVNMGARISTHLGNGCANYIHRHDNPIWPQLANDLLTPTIIADGHHLRKEELKVFFSVKGPHNLILVSDATKLSGMPPGEYQWDGKKVLMTSDGMLKYPEQDVLAGASFPVKRGIETMVGYGICDLGTAIQMATETPANMYHFAGKGKLEPGMDADIILFTFDDGKMEIQETILLGETVYRK